MMCWWGGAVGLGGGESREQGFRGFCLFVTLSSPEPARLYPPAPAL